MSSPRNTIRDTRDGVYFSFVDRTEVRDNDIEGVRYGLHYMYSDENRFEGNVFRDNAAGAAIMSSKDIVLRRNQFLANQSHRSYGILLQTVEDTTLEDNRIVGNTVGVFFESGHGNRLIGQHDRPQPHRHPRLGQLRRQPVRRQQLRRQPAHGGDHRRQPDQPLGDRRPRQLLGRRRRRSISIATASPTCRIANSICSGRSGASFPVIGLLAGSPGERLLRFVHARIALPGLPGVTDPAPLVQPTRP